MIKINANNKEYTLEFSFKAAEHSETVQKMFNVLSGTYVVSELNGIKTEKEYTSAMLRGTSAMVGNIPNIVKTCFYSGLLENHKVTEEEAYEIMKAYMKENKISYRKLFEDIKTCMEDDGFFELSGLVEMIMEMNENLEENIKKTPKTPQGHKKKSTGTK